MGDKETSDQSWFLQHQSSQTLKFQTCPSRGVKFVGTSLNANVMAGILSKNKQHYSKNMQQNASPYITIPVTRQCVEGFATSFPNASDAIKSRRQRQETDTVKGISPQ